MESRILNLTSNELANLKEIGHGTDGSVYLYKNNLLIKLYHKRVKEIISDEKDDDKDIKIYKTGTIKPNNFYYNDINYYKYDQEDDENIKILPKDGIKKAIERHDDIELTSLPIGIVYLDGHFAGCLLERQRGIQVHKLIGLPLNIRKKIYLNILKAEAELLKNNVYHIDLSNSPFAKKQILLPNGELITTGHSHVLVNPLTLDTHFIDLEGKSTIYTEKENKNFKNQSLSDLSILTLEFLLGIDWEDYKEDTEEIYREFEGKEIPFSLQEKLANQEASLEDFYELSRILKK